ncbi:hypothetical protein CONPUDRAFT_120069 [Coniophora puteana RWD-64-598 SS2]|uniref:Formin GTPase-binding domain-containing protein n=1 Tax=Coniophora puteana (strain RWD-64-598) TaxID=741705 RepID=A0A5M3MZ79_CONPW|nr:uncharacterized protein CONPUDRAFT_120069 [Coniophora puteana RWD-64-598 SS2]EIW84307.1 hypothetical protein CONPUDRAFT_120069 [Coniophora puteana RWD-64-598 SS2]
MFKGILPSKRLSTSDFTMVTAPPATAPVNGKENWPSDGATNYKPSKPVLYKGTTKKNEKAKLVRASVDKPEEPLVTEQAFDKLLDDLQIPTSLRPKLIGMDSTVKAAMIKSSHTVIAKPPPSPPHTPRTLRKAHSSESLVSPPRPGGFYNPTIGTSTADLSSHTSHERGVSIDIMRTMSRADGALVTSSDFAKPKDKLKSLTPVKLCSILSGNSSTELDVEVVKKLRLLLRNESASWSEEFMRVGGYNALLTRLNEILEVEWREEQHGDKVLHELLRCFKALSTSSIGCFALRSSCPTPFVQLVALLYSDKKPGDVATRQLIVELLLIMFELYPASSLPSIGSGRRREAWESQEASSALVRLPAPHKTLLSLMRALLLTPAPPPAESPGAPISPHAFIEQLHRPRIYKTYLQELSDVCRDYFWVFCHPNNTLWNLGEVDEGRVEKPRAPGGMTGGVEFEAMTYFTLHLRLINSMASLAHGMKLPKEDDLSAHRLHADLFSSGFERIILIARKASTAYYPTLHLELSRYISWTSLARYEIPWTISRLIGPPPTNLCKPVGWQSAPQTPRHPQSSTGRVQGPRAASPSPTKRSTNVPEDFINLPPPKRIEPLRFD